MEIRKAKMVSRLKKIRLSSRSPCKTFMVSKVHVKPFPLKNGKPSRRIAATASLRSVRAVWYNLPNGCTPNGCMHGLPQQRPDTVYVQQPEAYTDSSETGKILLLKKAIYGLKHGWHSLEH